MNKQEPVNCSDSELCTYLQALEGGFLPMFYSDISQCVPSRSMSIASKSYQRGKKTVSFHGFQSLTMYKHSTDGHGEGLLTSWPGGSHAKTSASPGKAQESTASAAGYGQRWPASLAKYDQDTHSWKTAQRSLLEDSDEFSVIWPRSGMTVDGECWELPMLVRRTKETGYGLWLYPTPTCNPEAPNHGSNSKGPHNLLDVAKQNWIPGMLWPTPKAHEPGMSAKTTGRDVTKSTHLTTQVALAEGMIDKQTGRLWRTPSASVVDAKSSVVKLTGRTPKDPQVGLADQVIAVERNSRPLSEHIGGHLNPTWVEWLMGWPIGWTDLNQLGMDKCHCAQQQHGNF